MIQLSSPFQPHPLPFSPTLPAPAIMIVLLLDHIYPASTLRLLQLLFHLPRKPPGSPVDSSFWFIRGLSIRVATWETSSDPLFEKSPHPVKFSYLSILFTFLVSTNYAFLSLLSASRSLKKKKRSMCRYCVFFSTFSPGSSRPGTQWCSVNKWTNEEPSRGD